MRLKIRVGNIEFEADGNENEVERERAAMVDLLEHLSAVNADIVLQPTAQGVGDNNMLLESNAVAASYQSFNELLKDITVKTDTGIVMAAAYFLYKYRGASSFTSRDIEELLTESHIRRPGNISQSITQNVKKGFVSLVKSSEAGLKAYQVLTAADDWFNHAKTSTD